MPALQATKWRKYSLLVVKGITQAYFSFPNGPEIDEKKANEVPREEDIEETMGGPNSIEEELLMRDLKIDGE